MARLAVLQPAWEFRAERSQETKPFPSHLTAQDIGIAMLSTLVTRREQFHSVRIGDSVTVLTPVVLARISSLDSMLLGKGIDPRTAHNTALTILNGEVQTQSFIMAYSDSFLDVGLILFASCGAVIFLPKLPGHPSSQSPG